MQKDRSRSFVSGVFILLFGSSISAATFTVTNTNDSGAGSLRQAILNADGAPTDDVIVFDAGVFSTPQTITLAPNSPLTTSGFGALTINGTGANRLTINGNNASRVFQINNSATLIIKDLTIANGNSGNADGGGILSFGFLTLINCTVRNNVTGGSGRSGGGISQNGGTLRVINSTFNNNGAYFCGAIHAREGIGGNPSNIFVINSTLSTNSAGANGGAIGVIAGSSLTVTNSTITNNRAGIVTTLTRGGGGIDHSSTGTSTIRNTIIAGNTVVLSFARGPDVLGTFVSEGCNLIGNTADSNGFGVPCDLLNVNPMLAPLANNAGTMQTHALMPGSPAIDAGNNALANYAASDPITFDQRGACFRRIVRGRVEIGAFETQSFASAVCNNFFDFDGDGRADLSIFRPPAGEWWYLRSLDNQNRAFGFGNSSDKLTPADFTGDGKTDIAIWRGSTGEWFVLRSEEVSYYSFPFGTTGDIPAVGDFDGDSRIDAAVFRPSNATWYVSRSSGGAIIRQFGANGDVPVAADYDGDGRTDFAVYRSGVWYYLRSSDDDFRVVSFGIASDLPVAGDYDGDLRADQAVYRSGEWHLNRSALGYTTFQFGIASDIPTPADYDGDGKTDAAVYRDGVWYLLRSQQGFTAVPFGITSDFPVPAAFLP